MYSTNYKNTLITPSPDCRVDDAEEPTKPNGIATLQFHLIMDAPYWLDSDDVITRVHATRKDISENDYADFRTGYFSKGQACLRASPLVKSHGWAIHHNFDGKIALIDPASEEFNQLSKDPDIAKVAGMRNRRA